MAGRFYHRPIDPGYSQFGAAIAAGMGQGIQNYERGKARQEEQARYESQQERQARLDAIAEQDRARRTGESDRAFALRMQELGYSPIAEATTPRPAGPMSEALPGALPDLSGGVATVPPGEMSTAPQQPMGGIEGARVGPEQLPPQRPEVAFSDELSGVDYAWDFNKSLESLKEEAGYLKAQKRQTQERERQIGIITRVMEDDEITPEERGELVANGIDPNTLQPFARDDRRHQQALELEGVRHGNTLERDAARARTTGGAGGVGSLTGNKALDVVFKDVRGQALRMKTLEGRTDREILDALSSYADQVGGEGVLFDLVESALSNPPSPQAIRGAEAYMENLFRTHPNPPEPGTPEYEEMKWKMAAEIDQRGRPDFSAPPPPADYEKGANAIMQATQAGISPFFQSKTLPPLNDRVRQIQLANPRVTPEEMARQLRAEGYNVEIPEGE